MRISIAISLVIFLLCGAAVSQPQIRLSSDATPCFPTNSDGAICPAVGEPFSIFVTLSGLDDEIDRWNFTLAIPRAIGVTAFIGPDGEPAHVDTPRLDSSNLLEQFFDVNEYFQFKPCVDASEPVVILEAQMVMPIPLWWRYAIWLTGIAYYDGDPVVRACGGDYSKPEPDNDYIVLWPHVATESKSWGALKALY